MSPCNTTAEMIDVICPRCRAVYHSQESHVGKHLRCAICGGVVPIVARSGPTAVQRASGIVDAVSRKVRTPLAKHPARRFRSLYPLVIAAAFVVIVGILTFSLRRPPSLERNPSNLTDVPEPAQSRQNQSGETTDRWKVLAEEDPIPTPTHETTADSRTPELDPRPTDYNFLPTGTRIGEDVGNDGHGKLTVENGTSEDAVVQLSELGTEQAVRCFFVQAHSSAHVAKIPQGTYRLTFTTGLNWVESDSVFSWHPSYSEFERIFQYSEQHIPKGVQYDDLSVTLHPVLFGNVRTKAITREEFLKGHRNVALPRQP